MLHYISLVRCYLKYANSVWNQHRQGLIKDLEKVQMRATKLVLTVKHATYKERLRRLKLPTFKYRHIRGYMIQIFKISTSKYDSNDNFSSELHQDSRTRRYNLKLVNHRCHYDLRKYLRTRIINAWNRLPESVISALTTAFFNNKRNKF